MKKEDNFYITSYCSIAKGKLHLNGELLYENDNSDFKEFIKEVYKQQGGKYAKFFKMDNLSKLAFLASDVLLMNENLNSEENDIAIVFSNNASSLDTDRKHQKSIQNKDNYYPSPAVFVYTLPNICIGEISIKHKLYSENSFFIFDTFNAEKLHAYANSLLLNNKAEQVLCGWVNYDEDTYEAFLYLVSKKGTKTHSIKEIITLYTT